MKLTIRDMDIVSDNERHAIGYFYDKRARIITNPKYQKCKDDLITLFKAQLPDGWEPVPGSWITDIHLRTYKDMYNLCKVVCDALEAAGVIDNDRDVGTSLYGVFTRKTPVKRGTLDTVEIYVYEDTNETLL